MGRYRRPIEARRTGILLLGALLPPAFIIAASHYANGAADDSQKIGPMNDGAQIECIFPDGRLSSVAATHPAGEAVASFIDNDTISCALREGETTFIIALPKNAPRDRLTFLNENAAACGELRIAVSNSPLPADSPKWTDVDGIVPFAHKRLFKLSMLGVDTKFVRLSFHVESPRRGGIERNRQAARVSNTFHTSALAEAINSNFSKLHAGTLI